MRASVIPETGGTDVIEIRDVPEPNVGDGDVLIEVAASAVNHTDVWIRRGYEGDPPIVTGIDVAGTVVEIGDDVTRFDGGERVVVYWNTTYCGDCEHCHHGETSMCRDYGGLGVKTDGGHAEYLAVDSGFAVELPDSIGFETAAAVPSNFGTAWRGLHTRADVRMGEDVLVLGASGGVGHGAVQIADRAGATVYAASSSEEKAAKLRELGADRVIDYTERDLGDAVRDHTDGRGVDVAFDSVGGETYKRAIESLARGGRLVTIGATTGDADAAMLQHVFWKQLEVIGATGSTMGEFTDMLAALFEGEIAPVIDRVIDLEEIPAAHERIESGDGFGKIIATP
jgi:NADPH:quinone reductase-like Zn-dependent oxidoreductase